MGIYGPFCPMQPLSATRSGTGSDEIQARPVYTTYWQGPVQTFSLIFCAGPNALGSSTAGRRME